MNGYTKRIAVNGFMASLAIILSYVEALIPINIGIPGIKLGLANVVIMFILYNGHWIDAVVVNVIRVLAVGFMFGNVNSIMFALAGAIASFAVMLLFKCILGRHIIVVSMFGAMAHVMGQLMVGLLWYDVNVLLYYSIFLLVAAVVTGIVLGVVADRINVLCKANINN